MARTVLFGSYELIDRIGEGGMAEVWRARSRGAAGFEKTVVIKRVLPSMMARPEVASLLVREAKIAARLNHPNIVQIFDLGEEQGAYFIAMEHVDGRDLASAMAYQPGLRGGVEGLGLPLRLWIVGEVAKALDHAHRLRSDDGRPLSLVHRDISPQNVLLGYEGQVKVADFGIALADERGLGREDDPREIRGKYAYMSPEQARGEPLDRRSDIFSLGIVLHELVTGERLFRADSRAETLERVKQVDVPPVDAAKIGAPPALAAIVARSLARDRDARYASAGDLADDITALLAEMRVVVDDTHLRDALLRMFPPAERGRENKLRVDLMSRAVADATRSTLVETMGTTPPGGSAPERTFAFPNAAASRGQVRPAIVLCAREAGSFFPLRHAAEPAGATVLPPTDGVHRAVFGHQGGVERAASQAVTAALEVRRLRGEAAPPMVVLPGRARVVERADGTTVELEDDTRAKASSMLEGTGPGDVVIDPSLVEELEARFRLDEGSPPRVLGFRDRAERDALHLRASGPLVGRRELVRVLGEALVDGFQGRGRALLLLGEAGVGKSRSIAELRRLGAGRDVAFVRGRTDPAAPDRAFALLADLLLDLCGVDDEDGPEARAKKIERLRVLRLSAREVNVVRSLAGLSTEHAGLRNGRPRGLEIISAARKALRALVTERPVVVALEDLQWIDECTRGVLPLFVEFLVRGRVLLLMTARPGPTVPVLDVETQAVEPLDAEHAGRLFASCVGARELDARLGGAVHEATGGNPAWIEAVAKTALEARVVTIDPDGSRAIATAPLPLPQAMATLVGARLAALRPRERELLRAVAAMGEAVDLASLGEVEGLPLDVVGWVVRRLVSLGLVRAPGASAIVTRRVGRWGGGEGEVPLPYKLEIAGGSLLARAIEETLPEAARGKLHDRIASALERTGAANDDDRITVLARQAARASDRRRAPDYLVRAGEVALRRGRIDVAARCYGDAARVALELDDDDRTHVPWALGLRAAELALEVGLVADAEAVLRLFEAAEARPTETDVALRLGLAHARLFARRERWAEAVSSLRALSGEIAETRNESLRTQLLVELGIAEVEQGEVEDAIETLRIAVDALSTADDDESVDLYGRGLSGLGVGLGRAGVPGTAVDDVVTAAFVAAARTARPGVRYGALVASAEVAEARGQLETAAARFRDAAHVARREGLMLDLARAALRGAIAAVASGADAEAAVLADEACRVAKANGFAAVASLGAAVQAALAILTHPDPGYVPAVVRAVEELEALGRPGEAALALEMLARAHLALGDVPAAIRTLGRASGLAHVSGRRALESRMRKQAEHLAEHGAEDRAGG